MIKCLTCGSFDVVACDCECDYHEPYFCFACLNFTNAELIDYET